MVDRIGAWDNNKTRQKSVNPDSFLLGLSVLPIHDIWSIVFQSCIFTNFSVSIPIINVPSTFTYCYIY